MGIKDWFSKEAIAARKHKQKYESIERHKKLYPEKYTNDAIKVDSGDQDYTGSTAERIMANDQPMLMKTEERIIRYQKRHIPNPLHEYNNFSPVITLIALTKEEVNFPFVLKNTGDGQYGKYVIAQTSGKTGNPANVSTYIDKSVDTNLEFLIDNLEIDSVVAPTKRNKHTQSTNIRFQVTEPYSVGLFISTMKIQAARASKQNSSEAEITAFNHTKAPYALLIDYVGTKPDKRYDTDTGQYVRINQQGQEAIRHIIPIHFQSVQFTANQGGAIYDCIARPHVEYGLDDINNTIPEDITIKGHYVHQILQSGPDSLMHFLNQKGDYDEKAKNYDKVSKQPDGEEFVIVFPPDDFQNGDMEADDRNKTLVDISEGYADDVAEDYGDERQYRKNKQVLGTYDPGKIVTQLLQGKYDQQDFFIKATDNSKSLNYGGGISVTQSNSGGTFVGNDIGKARMIWDKNVHKENTKNFPDFEENYSFWSGTYKRDGIKIDFRDKQLSFPKGTRVTDIIEIVLILSEYGKKFGDTMTKDNDETGYTQWFRIIPQCFELKNSYVEARTKSSYKVIVCNIVKYGIMTSILADDDKKIPNLTLINNAIVKRYDYLYSGMNHDILDFDLQYNFAFYNSQTRDPNNTKSAKPGKKGEDEYQVVQTTKYETADGKSVYSSHGRNVATNSDINSQATIGESASTSFARDFNQKLINSSTDLFDINLTIHGDPFFVPNSGNNNYINLKTEEDLKSEGSSYMVNSDKEIQVLKQQFLIEITFISPIDINKKEGSYILPTATLKDREGAQRVVNEFGGIFRVIEIKSEFRGGRFTQVLRCVRSGNMTVGGKDVKVITKTYKIKEPQKNKNNNIDEKDPNNAFDVNGLGGSA